MVNPESNKRKVVAYARVSTNSQRDDLKNQIDFIRQYVNAKGIILDETITDVGSGLNYNRKKWNKLLEEVMNNQIDTIYITYKDRFIRFGYIKIDLFVLVMSGLNDYVKYIILRLWY